MPSIPPVSSVPAAATTGSGSPTTASRVPQKMLGREDFMKLLAVQFQMQDPMKPMEDTAFIAQTAQFSALDQATTMATEITQVRADQQRVVANSYLGHRVTVDVGEGQTITGDVSAIDSTDAAPRIVVNGEPYALSAVLRVESSLTTAPAPVTSGT